MNRRRTRAYVYLALAMATVGSIVPASRIIAGALPPALAGPFTWHDRLILAVQAAGGTVGFTVLMVLGTARTTATDASVVAGTLPAVAAGLSMLLFRERPGPRRWLAVALAMGGLVAVQLPGAGGGPAAAGRFTGNLLVLGAVGSESLFILLQKRLRRPLPALAQSAVMTALGLAYLAVPAARELQALDVRAVPAAAWWAVAYYGLVPTVLGFVWWYRGAAEVTGAEAGVFTAVMPLSGAGLSALVLGEPLHGRHAVALALVLAAVVLVARSEGGGQASGRAGSPDAPPRPDAQV